MEADRVMLFLQDFHPTAALLAHAMEVSRHGSITDNLPSSITQTTDVDIAIAHDDEWCSIADPNVTTIIDEYARCFFKNYG